MHGYVAICSLFITNYLDLIKDIAFESRDQIVNFLKVKIMKN